VLLTARSEIRLPSDEQSFTDFPINTLRMLPRNVKIVRKHRLLRRHLTSAGDNLGCRAEGVCGQRLSADGARARIETPRDWGVGGDSPFPTGGGIWGEGCALSPEHFLSYQ